MHNAFAGCHPLHTMGFDYSFITNTIFMTHAPSEHISDCFKASMGVVWKSTNIIQWLITTKGIEQEEWIQHV